MQRAPSLAVALALAAAGCSSSPERSASERADVERAARVLRRDADTGALRLSRVSPPASLGGQPVEWEALHDAMVEAAGAVALEEAVLDRLLDREAERLNIAVETVDLEHEERSLLDSLRDISSPSASPALLEELRRQRGLGPRRYEALLRRTAIMRAIVAPDVVFTEDALELARTIRFGEKHRVRIVVIPSLAEARTALLALDRGDPFAEVAARFSTDASAASGGLLDPLSLADPSYPATLRDAARPLAPGQRSGAFALDGGYAVLQLEAIIPPSIPRDAESIVLADARAEQERLLMTRLARRLLGSATLTIHDPALESAWRRRAGQ